MVVRGTFFVYVVLHTQKSPDFKSGYKKQGSIVLSQYRKTYHPIELE